MSNINNEIDEYKVIKIIKKNNKYIVYFDNYESELILHEDLIVEYRIIVGNIFTSKELNEIKNSEKIALYYNKAIHYIDFKPRSEQEVYNYFINLEIDNKNIDKIIKKLKVIHYIDDERYTKSFVLECIRKAKGRNYILQTLLSKGIDQNIILKYLNDYLLDDEKNNALKVTNKLMTSIKKNPIKKQKMQITNKLLQEGYSYDIINSILGGIAFIDDSSELLNKEYQKLLIKENDKNKIIIKLLNKGFEYQDIKKIIDSCKYN